MGTLAPYSQGCPSVWPCIIHSEPGYDRAMKVIIRGLYSKPRVELLANNNTKKIILSYFPDRLLSHLSCAYLPYIPPSLWGHQVSLQPKGL